MNKSDERYISRSIVEYPAKILTARDSFCEFRSRQHSLVVNHPGECTREFRSIVLITAPDTLGLQSEDLAIFISASFYHPRVLSDKITQGRRGANRKSTQL